VRRTLPTLALALLAGFVLLWGVAPAARRAPERVGPAGRAVPSDPAPVVVPELAPAPLAVPASTRAAAPPVAFAGASPGPLAAVAASVSAPGGERLDRVRVVLWRGALEVGNRRLDGSGRAPFGGLAPGRYALEIESRGLPPGLLAAADPLSGSARVPFELARGERREIPLALVRGASLFGRVRDAHGGAVEGALLRLQPVQPAPGWLQTRGDERGAFELPDVQPGTYRLHVRWPAGARDLGVPPLPRVLELAPGALVDLDLRGTSETRAIEGLLVDVEGRPLAGETVQCELVEDPDEDPLRAAPWSRVLRSARTDAAGRYHLVDLPAARVSLRAAPRSGGSPAPGVGRSDFAEELVGSFDLRLSADLFDGGTTVLSRRGQASPR
jgi:hypothetical protein